MAVATLVSRFRVPDAKSVYTVPVYSDLAANSNIIKPGDLITVLSSGVVYECVYTDLFQPVTPVGPSLGTSGGWRGVSTTFIDGVGNPVAATTASVTIPGSGVRNFGHGVEVADGGMTVSLAGPVPVASLIASATSGLISALGVASTTGVWTPASNGPYYIDVNVAMSAALTTRRMFCGFVTAPIDALDPVVTGATTVLTGVGTDYQGFVMDSGLTASTGIFCVYRNASAPATLSTTAAGVDSGSVFPTAGTYIRMRVQVNANGTVIYYLNGVEVSRVVGGAATGVLVSPVLYICSLAAATQTMLVKSFEAYSLA